MARMPSFAGLDLSSPNQRLIDLVQAQEILLMIVRRDDHWDVEARRFGSRRKHMGTVDLMKVDRQTLGLYYLHLLDKEMEVTDAGR